MPAFGKRSETGIIAEPIIPNACSIPCICKTFTKASSVVIFMIAFPAFPGPAGDGSWLTTVLNAGPSRGNGFAGVHERIAEVVGDRLVGDSPAMHVEAVHQVLV